MLDCGRAVLAATSDRLEVGVRREFRRCPPQWLAICATWFSVFKRHLRAT